MIQKIEKVRKFNFKYKKNIIHTPMFVQGEPTEMYNLDGWSYSFLKIDGSLKNVIREKSCKNVNK
jgi:hypothetical protein